MTELTDLFMEIGYCVGPSIVNIILKGDKTGREIKIGLLTHSRFTMSLINREFTIYFFWLIFNHLRKTCSKVGKIG